MRVFVTLQIQRYLYFHIITINYASGIYQNSCMVLFVNTMGFLRKLLTFIVIFSHVFYNPEFQSYFLILWIIKYYMIKTSNNFKEVQLQPFDNGEISKLRDVPPPSHVLQKVKLSLENTSDPKVQEYEPITNPFWGYISPLDTYLLLWDFFVMIAMYVFFFEMGFLLAFTSTFWINLKSFSYTLGLYIILLAIFTVDIWVNLHKGFYKIGEGHIIMKREQIIKRYLKGKFSIDLISLFCVILPLFVQSSWNFVQLLFLLKYSKKKSYQKQILRGLEDRQHISLLFSLVILIIDATLVSHYIASIFLRIDTELWNAQYYGNNTNLYWLSNNADYPLSLIGGVWYQQYIYAQDYSTGTLSTLAPGPFAKNPLQVIYVNIIMVFLIILSSFLADGIVRIFYWQTEKRVAHQNKLQCFVNFLQSKKVSPTIKHKTQNYFELVWEVEGKIDKDAEQSAIAKLSTKLKRDLMFQIMNFKYIKFISYFRGYEKQLQDYLIPHISQNMTDSEEGFFKPENKDLIDHQHEIIIISLGQAKFTIDLPNRQQIILGFTNIEKVLGVYQFITQQNYFCSVKTIHMTHYHCLQRKEFIEVLKKLKLTEMFIQLLYKVQVERKLECIGKCCVVCLGTHLQRDCPSIIFSKRVANILKYSKNMKYLDQQERIFFKRRDVRNTRTLNKKSQISSQDPLSYINSLFIGRFVHDIVGEQVFEVCHNFDQFYPFSNISNFFQ